MTMKTRPFQSMAAGACLMIFIAGDAFATPPETTAGLFLKVILDVSQKTSSKDWTPVQKGWPVAFGDMVRTGDKSLAVIRFADKSLVKVRERSEMIINGTMGNKDVSLQRGVIG